MKAQPGYSMAALEAAPGVELILQEGPGKGRSNQRGLSK